MFRIPPQDAHYPVAFYTPKALFPTYMPAVQMLDIVLLQFRQPILCVLT